MENNILNIEGKKKQSLEAWVNEIIKPVLSAIGHVSYHLELLYQELS